MIAICASSHCWRPGYVLPVRCINRRKEPLVSASPYDKFYAAHGLYYLVCERERESERKHLEHLEHVVYVFHPSNCYPPLAIGGFLRISDKSAELYI